MEKIEIRWVEPAEFETLTQISRETFIETFGPVNSAENMQLYLEESLDQDQLKKELANPASAFFFALHETRVIGYLKLNYGQAQTELKDPTGIEIERIYVLKEFHGSGVGKMLFNTALLAANSLGAAFIWLGVWEENHKAISFYKKYGFVEFGKHSFRLGKDVQTDCMMKLELNDYQPLK